jgi:cytochrome P450
MYERSREKFKNTMTSEENTLQFLDILSKPKKYQHNFFDEKKEIEPIFKFGKNHWIITRYEDINLILHDDNFLKMYNPNEPNAVRSILDLDFEDHMKYRKILNKVFNSSLTKSLKIDEKIYNNLQTYKNKEIINIIDDVALPVPILVMFEIFGVPLPSKEEISLIKKWTSSSLIPMSIRITKRGYKEYSEDIENLSNYLINIIFNDKKTKKEGLITYLRSCYLDGRKLNNEEIFSICALIFLAGFETTLGSISSSIFNIIEDKHIDKFNNQTTLNNKIQMSNEIMRHSSNIRYTTRVASNDYVMNENSNNPIFLSQGDFVIAYLESGNRDKTIFKDPHNIILNRENSNKNLGFGGGAHHCLGAGLAREQLSPIICSFFKNIKNPVIVGEPIKNPSDAVNGFSDLHVMNAK